MLHKLTSPGEKPGSRGVRLRASQMPEVAISMSTFIGYFHPTESHRQAAEARAMKGESGWDPKFIQMVVDLPLKLPAGCQMVGTYGPVGGATATQPSVCIVEAADAEQLQFISNHYAGWLEFSWAPTIPLGASKNQREEWRQQLTNAPSQSVR